jgi:monoterpene epsilon-lactone hydrolase
MALSTEDRIRKVLTIVRFVQTSVRPSTAQTFLKRTVAHVRLPDGIRHEPVSADGVACEWIIPRDPSSNRVLIYIHGGGFVFGQTPLHMKMGAYLSNKMGARVLMVDYRLSPKYPFPAALDDCVAVYRWAVKQDVPEKSIVIAGDSAGGNLTITTLMKLRDDGDRLPAAAACLSPVVNLVPNSNDLEGMEDPVLPPKAVEYYNKSYVGANDPSNPLISPLLGNLRNLPPLLIHVGEQEILRDNAISFAGKAKEAGVYSRYEVYARMWHVWQLFEELPEAARSLNGIAEFLLSSLR